MNFQPRTADFYAGVRSRLRGHPPAYGSDLLPRDQNRKRFFTYSKPHSVADPIPNQRRLVAHQMTPLSNEQLAIATRRALATFSRMRSDERHRRPTPQLMKAIAEAFKMDVDQIFGRNNCHATTAPRQIAMALLGPLTGYNQCHVGRLLSRDHTTVFHAKKKVAGLIDGLSCQIRGSQ